MKTKVNLILSLLLVFGLASCVKTETPDAKEGDNVLVVRLPANIVSKGTRAVEDPVTGGATTKTEVVDARVFLMMGPSVVSTEEFTSADLNKGFKRFEQVSTSIDNVLVVANQRGENLGSLSSYSSIMNYAFTVASQNNVDGIAEKTLIGEGAPVVATPDPENHEHVYKEAEVTVNSLTSRLEVGDVCPGEGVESVEMVAVYINNYYSDGSRPTPLILHPEGDEVWETTPVAGVPSNDASTFTTANTDKPYTEPFYRIEGNSAVDWENPGKCYAFQVFTGSYVPHLIVLVKGKYKPTHAPEGKEYFFGWVTFTKFTYMDNSTKKEVVNMDPNMIYKMGLDSGIPINAKDITNQPEKGKMDVSVEIIVTPWSELTVTPEV